MKKIFGLRKLTSRELCSLAMLLAVTLIFSVFFTFRIGDAVKIPTKFLPIAVTAMLFGPVWGGCVAILADILAYIINPVSVFMPQITFIEFLYGFTYGLFLKNATNSFSGYAKGSFCVIFQIIFLHILLTSYFLMPITGLDYKTMIIYRLSAGALNAVLQLAGICFVIIYSNTFRKISGGIKQ